MSLLDGLRYRLRVLFRGDRYGRDLDEEIGHYIELETREQERAGSSRADADAKARATLRNVTYVNEERRIISGLAVFDAMRQDTRFVLRVLRRRRVFAAVTVATLALGIGAATSIFSIADVVLFRPLPLRDADRIITVWQTRPDLRLNQVRAGQWDRGGISLPDYRNWRATQTSFEHVAIWTSDVSVLNDGSSTDEVPVVRASASMLSVIDVHPEIGRWFSEAEDDVGGERVAVLSREAWTARFGNDPHIIGRRVVLDSVSYAIIGVLPQGIRFDRRMPPPSFWIPSGQNAEDAHDAGADNYWALGRIKSGVSLATAAAETERFVKGWSEGAPIKRGVRLTPLRDDETRRVRAPILLLLAASALLLLIACANVATVLMGEATVRDRELSARLALGASRGRLVRQLLTESMVLSIISGVCGVAIAQAGTKLIVHVAPPWIPGLADIRVDARVLAAALILSCLTGVLFGIVPALLLSRSRQATLLRAGGHASSGRGQSQRVLVACEVALSMVLLVGAALLVKSFARINAVDLGFRRDQLIVVRLRLPEPQYADLTRLRAFYAELVTRVHAVPGVIDVAVTTTPPFSGGSSSSSFEVEGRPLVRGVPGPEAQRRVTSGDYFKTTGIPLLEGRSYSDADRLESAPVLVVSRSLARREWPTESAIGKRIKWLGQWRTIIGVVGDVKLRDLFESVTPTMYAPLSQVMRGATPSVVVRARPNAAELAPTIRALVQATAADVTATDVDEMSDLISSTLSDERFRTELISVFAAIAALLAAVGMYGVAATAASRRTREMAIRSALGANDASIISLIVRAGASGVVAGAVTGVALSLVAMRTLRPYLYGIGAMDPWSYASVVLLLGLTTLAATWIPARRVTRIPLVDTLRGD